MELGFVTTSDRGQSDGLLWRVAQTLLAEGLDLAGVVQTNIEFDPDRPCHMDLHVLGRAQVIRISQNLGAHSSGCRLDASGLEMAVAQVESSMDGGQSRLMIVNKFGKQEAEGRGFRPVIGRALLMGLPVLTAVSALNRIDFETFADGLARELPARDADVLAWCRAAMA